MSLLKIARWSFLSTFFKVIYGPVVLIYVSIAFSSEMLGFYYVFLSIAAMQQVFEAGMSNVLKQHYAHTDHHDIKVVEKILSFSIVWFGFLSLVLFFILYWSGNLNFYSYTGGIRWQEPWLLMCIASLISFNTLSVKIHLDGTQKQVLLKKIELISAVIYALSLIVLIKSNLDLYSVGLASSISSMSTVCMFIAIGYKDKIKQAISNFKFKNFKNTFREVFPLFKRTIFVWVSGYIFWNSFNIISLRVMGVVYTGQIGLTISLFRAGLNVSLSIVIGQMTAYAKLISSGSEEIARKSFVKYLAISSLILVSGYSLFTILYHMSYLGEFGSKLLPIGELKYITIFFLFTFIATALNNYVRCFKIEPFVTLSAFNAFATSLAFYYSLLYSSSGFTYVVLVSLVVCCWSFYIFVDKIKGSNE